MTKDSKTGKNHLRINIQGDGNESKIRENIPKYSIYFRDVAVGVESSSSAIQNPVIFNYNDLSKIYERKDSGSKSLLLRYGTKTKQ